MEVFEYQESLCRTRVYIDRHSVIEVPFGGFRGGNWNNDATNARVSDRNNAANTNTNRNNNNGGRCARTSSFCQPQLKKKMNKIRDIYPKIIAKENLYCSAYMASRGRRYRDTTADFNFNIEEEIDRLHRELSAKTYRHGKYRLFTIYEPKERKIAAAPFRDRVVHHAIHDIIEPLIDKTFIYDSYACRRDKGTHKAVDRAEKFLRANAFCFHGDIKKYFPSINHEILKGLLRMRIEDRDLLWLLDEVVDSAKQLAVGDSRFAEKGLPIGNLTSQFFANFYLNELDYFIKHGLRRRYYLRYMDDFLVFDNDKIVLWDIKDKIRKFLKDILSLELHVGKSQIYKTRNGIKFLGFRIYKDYRRLTSSNVRRFRKRLKRFAYLFKNEKKSTNKICDSVRCWVAHSKYADTKALRFNIWSDLVKKGEGLGNLLKDIFERERERERESKDGFFCVKNRLS